MNTAAKPKCRVIGPFRVESADAVDITPRGKRSKALLAMLALAPNGTRSRKWLQDKLWSGREPLQAAASLRQELSELRRHFRNHGLDLLFADREIVRLDLQSVSLDVDELQAEDVCQDLLEGLDVADPEFDDWLRDERRHWETTLEKRARLKPSVEIVPASIVADCRISFARPCVGLYGDFDRNLDPVESSAGNLFLDLVARSILSFDAVDVLDLRMNPQLGAGSQGMEGPDWILEARVSAHGETISISISLRAVEENRTLWSQLRHFDLGIFHCSDHLKLGAFVNEVVFVALDQVLHPRLQQDQARHEAARLAIGAVYQIFRLQDADLEAAERNLLRAYEIEPKSSYLAWLLFICVTRLGERRVGRTGPFYDQARDYASRAVEADAFNPITLALTAHAHSFIFREYEYALELADRAVDANPMLAISRDIRALTFGYLGEVEKGYAEALCARELGGPPPYRYCIDTTCCILSTLNGRFEEGIRHGRRALAQQRNFLPALRYTASCEGHLGQTAAAARTLAKLRELEPDFSLELLMNEDYPIAGLLGVSVIQKGLSRALLTAHTN